MTEEVEKPLDGLTDEEKSTVITNAVKEIELQDILVCGKCNAVYYFVEEFKEHKEGESCKENGEIKEALKDDKKPQIWAFTLWKNAKFKRVEPAGRPATSWHIYQTWRAMKPPEKQLWMTVATNMQELFEIVSLFEKSKIKYVPKKEEEKETKPPVILNKIKASNSRRAYRTGGDPNVEILVEKMISKRYNPRRKRFEYLVKWEDLDSEDNTWEGGASLYNCKQMMEDFEKFFQAQKEQNRAQKTLEKQARATKAAEKMIISSESRPQRTSKQKALNQVKAWCGAESQDQEYGEKRVFSDDSDDDESYEKRIKLEPEDSDSEDAQPVVTIKRVTKNGVERRLGTAHKLDGITLPDNVLIPDAKGIVRISQKQIPSLSSGVYVMSKTAGIIKLDTAAASKLTQGGGQTVLKVAPKIGQASIKVIKKAAADVSNGSKPSVKIITQAGSKTAVKNYSGKVYMQRRTNAQAAAAVAAHKKLPAEGDYDQEPNRYDDESDGIEEMAFPDEIQLPTAESPPPDFSLCPLTGKVVDKNGTVVEGAAPEAEGLVENMLADDAHETVVNVKIEQCAPATTTTTPTKTYSTSLDNLVNIAAADILNDFKNTDIKSESDGMETGEDIAAEVLKSVLSPVATTTMSPQTLSSPPPLVPASPTMRTIKQASTTSPSILSTALTNANIVRRGPPKLVRRVVEPRVGLVQTRTPPHQIVRQVGAAGQSTVVTRIGPSGTTQQVRQIRPGTQVIRKRIVQVPAGAQGQGPRSVMRQQTRVYQQVVKSSPQVTQVTYVATPTHSNKIITMPSLETTPVATAVTTPVRQTAPKVQPVVQQVAAPVQSVAAQQAVQSPPPPAAAVGGTDATTLSLTDTDTPLLITGEDGTIYQVAGQNEDGQTILITHGEDGEQQCLLVAPENAGLITQALLKPAQAQEAVAQQQLQLQQHQQQQQQQQQAIVQEEAQSAGVDQELSINTAVEQAVEEATDDSQVVAQIVSANPPSPGGTRKVVLMLPDGNFMMTEVTADQYAALELDK